MVVQNHLSWLLSETRRKPRAIRFRRLSRLSFGIHSPTSLNSPDCNSTKEPAFGQVLVALQTGHAVHAIAAQAVPPINRQLHKNLSSGPITSSFRRWPEASSCWSRSTAAVFSLRTMPISVAVCAILVQWDRKIERWKNCWAAGGQGPTCYRFGRGEPNDLSWSGELGASPFCSGEQ